jgi:glycosyltransferase involved in cell wall biosynthesis
MGLHCGAVGANFYPRIITKGLKLMQANLVSVMMPAYNAEEFVAEAIESILAQTYPQWELLVVNDGSTDNTADIVAQYTDPRIKLIHKENGGESSARNMALDHSQGEFIAYLDADDAYLPHHLEVTVNYLLTNPDRDAVYTDGYHYNQSGERLQSLSSRRRGPFEGRIFEEIVRASDVFGPPMCVVLRQNIVAEHHLRYDTRIVIGPDWDFFIRYSDLTKFGYINDHTGLYRVHQSNITVQIDMQKRAGYLAICRENAIKMENFKLCPDEIRTAVFYDLLVNLLATFPEQQTAATQWPEFKDLPVIEQARLLRLIASQAIVNGEDKSFVRDWFDASQALNPADRRSVMLAEFYKMSPSLCRLLLKIKNSIQPQRSLASPLGDIG